MDTAEKIAHMVADTSAGGNGPSMTSNLLTKLLVALLLLASAVGQAPPKPQAEAPAEHHITPQEAQELLSSIDGVLKFDSENTKLPILHPVKRQLASRDQVQKFVETRMKEDEQAQRLSRSAVVLKKFGLLPKDFDLEAFLIELLREQVAGYYDAKTKTVYLLDWLPAGVQLPVMAHELTHALQDQNFNLEKWTKAVEPGKKSTPQQTVLSDEQIAARQAVIEGQAMAVMIDYVLAPTGGSLVDSPLLVKAIQAGMLTGPGSEVFQRAPAYLRQSLLFPYNQGLNFMRELLIKRGKEGAYAGIFKNPPQDTLEIMEPGRYLAGQRVVPLSMPDFDAIVGPDYERFDVGAIGAFDVSVLVSEFGTPEQAELLWPKWRGGYYYAAKKKGSAADALAIVYFSRWASPEAASEFAKIYGASLRKRYQMLWAANDLVKSSPFSTGSAECGCDSGLPAPALQSETSDGTVSVQANGEYVLVMETFDPQTAAKVRDTAFAGIRPPTPQHAPTH